MLTWHLPRSYLPLAHIYERFNFTLVTHYGAAAGFYRQARAPLHSSAPPLCATVPADAFPAVVQPLAVALASCSLRSCASRMYRCTSRL